jgi:iron complex outermembrane receptor protein
MINCLLKRYVLFIHIWAIPIAVTAQQTLKGKITDASTTESLPGVTVYIADLKLGAVTNADGNYTIANLPSRKFLVQVKLIGYSTITEMVDVTVSAVKDFKLSTSAIEAHEVVVTGSAFTTDREKSSISVVPIDKTQLLSSASNNIISAIAKRQACLKLPQATTFLNLL